MALSCRRTCMPELPESKFLEAVNAVVAGMFYCYSFVTEIFMNDYIDSTRWYLSYKVKIFIFFFTEYFIVSIVVRYSYTIKYCIPMP